MLPLEFQIFTVRISRILLEKNTKHREGWKLGRHKKASTLQTIFFSVSDTENLTSCTQVQSPCIPFVTLEPPGKGRQIVILKDYRYFIANDHRLSCFSPTEHVCSIIMWLFRNLSGNLRTRLVQKFVENDHIKVDRLMELHFKYHSKIQECDTKIEKEKQVTTCNYIILVLKRFF